MASRSHRISWWQTVCAIALSLGLVLASPTPAVAGDQGTGSKATAAEAEPTRSVVVGKATLNWHLASPAIATKRAELAAAFRKATEAHLTGAEPYVTPKVEPVTLPGGQLKMRLPTELIHTMFANPEGHPYCSDSTVPAKAAAVSNADGEVR